MERFDYFSDGWIFRYAPLENKDEWFVSDFRYAIDPASALPLWGIRFSPKDSEKGVTFERLREVNAQERERFMQRLFGPSS
jgi:inner membrane protein